MEKGYGTELAKIASSLLTLRFDRLIFLFQSHKVAAVSWILLLIPATAYLLLRRTGFLLREAKEPFKYTFWIEPFSFAKDTPGEGRCKLAGGERFAELHHDLMERLVRRIGRFSVLNEAAQGEKSGSKTPES